MQLSVLQAQIEPHFLYNTLASVQYLVKKDSQGAGQMLAHLIKYLRNAMPKMRMAMSTLGQEFELADAYLQIARIRMGGRLSVEIEIVDDLRVMAFPPLIVQTLIENALKHGVEPKTGPVSIALRAGLNLGTLEVQVEDNGLGLGTSKNPGSGTGLSNIRSRLHAIYGERAIFALTDRPNGGVKASVRISTKLKED
jgi:LytS/YehU family sensor histidine kinase